MDIVKQSDKDSCIKMSIKLLFERENVWKNKKLINREKLIYNGTFILWNIMQPLKCFQGIFYMKGQY